MKTTRFENPSRGCEFALTFPRLAPTYVGGYGGLQAQRATGQAPGTPDFRLVTLVALLTTLFLTGCKSSSGGADSGFASVVIRDRSEAQIRQTAETVFKADGYDAFGTPGGRMTFEKRGSRANDLAYGGWIEDRTTRVRVKAEIVLLPDGAHRLQCQAYMVAHAGDTLFQEEHKLSSFSAGPYRKLLDETARRLK